MLANKLRSKGGKPSPYLVRDALGSAYQVDGVLEME